MYLLPLSGPVAARRSASFGRELRALDRLFDESFRTTDSQSRTPTMDVSETDAAYTVAFEVPGVSREQLDVSIDGRRVTLKTIAAVVEAAATGDAPSAVAASRMLYRERSKTAYARTVSLPTEVDNGASQAKFENGVLTLTLAKKVPTGASRLAIG